MSISLKQTSLPLVFHPDYTITLPKGHRFPMEKYSKILRILLNDGVVSKESIFIPKPANRNELCIAHNKDYIDAVFNNKLDSSAERLLGFKCNKTIVRRARAAVGGTILAARLALKYQIACNTAGGSHHGHPGHAAGFCIFNDVAVAVKVLQKQSIIHKALIIDLDVHQGDGTACFFSCDPTVFTFSIHCETNYPDKKKRSDMDFGLPQGTGDDTYLDCLRKNLPIAISKAQPDIVFLNAGVDPHIDDKLGKLNLSSNGLLARDLSTLNLCQNSKIPVACVLGGGYSDDLNELAQKHTTIHRAAKMVLNSE